MKAYSIKLSNGMNTYFGKMIIGKEAMYFLCASKGNALLENAGIGLGGVVGGVLKALASEGNYGELPPEIDEKQLSDLVLQLPGSIIFEAKKIELIQDSWYMKMIKWDNKKIGVPIGFIRELSNELVPWAKKHNINLKGF